MGHANDPDEKFRVVEILLSWERDVNQRCVCGQKYTADIRCIIQTLIRVEQTHNSWQCKPLEIRNIALTAVLKAFCLKKPAHPCFTFISSHKSPHSPYVTHDMLALKILPTPTGDATPITLLNMEPNPYAAPQAELSLQTEEDAPLYIVSTKKFWVMLIATLGLYQMYWFYKNWKLYKDSTNRDIWPIPRAIFNIFFAHSLNRIVDRRIKSQQLAYHWSPDTFALIFVVFAIIGNACDRMSMKGIGSPVTDILGLVLVPIWGWAMWQTQLAINVACRDIEGESNSTFTVANYVWMAIGGLFWALMLFGLYMVFTGQMEA